MFGINMGYGRSAKSYNAIDVTSRIEGATPHGLVAILYDEFLKCLDALIALGTQGEPARRNERHAKAIAILHGLEGALDFDKGGDIAKSFAQIYHEARRLVGSGQRDNDMRPLAQCRTMIADIADAWGRIG